MPFRWYLELYLVEGNSVWRERFRCLNLSVSRVSVNGTDSDESSRDRPDGAEPGE